MYTPEKKNLEHVQPSTSKQLEVQILTEYNDNVQFGTRNSDSDQDEMHTPKKRNPRYVGEIKTSNSAIPRSAKEVLLVLKESVKKQDHKIKNLQQQNRRLTRKVRSSQNLIEHLRSQNLITKEAANALLVCINTS